MIERTAWHARRPQQPSSPQRAECSCQHPKPSAGLQRRALRNQKRASSSISAATDRSDRSPASATIPPRPPAPTTTSVPHSTTSLPQSAPVSQAAAMPWDAERLLNLMTRMAQAGKKPDDEWCDMLYGSTTAVVNRLTERQRARLVVQLSELGVQPPLAWVECMTQMDMSELGAEEALRLWSACQDMRCNLTADWLRTVMWQVAKHVQELSAGQVAIAIAMAAASALHLTTDERKHLEAQASASPQQQQQQMRQQCIDGLKVLMSEGERARWLDTLLSWMSRRVDELGLEEAVCEELPVEAVVGVAAVLTDVFRHQPPDEWQQVVSHVALLPRLTSTDSAQLAIAMAAARHMPDTVFLPQLYLVTYGELARVPVSLLCDIVWAVGTWCVGAGGRAWDLRPPAMWWDNWFQETGKALRDGLVSRECLIRLLWSLAILRVRPPEAWTQLLVSKLAGHLMAHAFTALELLYVSKAGDMWYGMLLGVDTPLPGAGPGITDERVGRPLSIAGTQTPYTPPVTLAALVRDSTQLMTSVTLPSGWNRINFRYPPYSLPARHETRQDPDAQESNCAASAINASQLPNSGWQSTEAARRIYGPLKQPSW